MALTSFYDNGPYEPKGWFDPQLTLEDWFDDELTASGAASPITGSGALISQSAVIAGVGITASRGDGALISQTVILAGIGISASRGTGSLVAQDATIAGEGTVAGGDGGPVAIHTVLFLTNIGFLR